MPTSCEKRPSVLPGCEARIELLTSARLSSSGKPDRAAPKKSPLIPLSRVVSPRPVPPSQIPPLLSPPHASPPPSPRARRLSPDSPDSPETSWKIDRGRLPTLLPWTAANSQIEPAWSSRAPPRRPSVKADQAVPRPRASASFSDGRPPPSPPHTTSKKQQPARPARSSSPFCASTSKKQLPRY